MPRPLARRFATGAVLTGGVLGAALFGVVTPASASPPNCTAADLEGVRAGVSAATSAYLFTHPDFNDYVTSLAGQPREAVAKKTQAWLAQHPQEQAEITGIRQPLIDIKNRCGGR